MVKNKSNKLFRGAYKQVYCFKSEEIIQGWKNKIDFHNLAICLNDIDKACMFGF